MNLIDKTVALFSPAAAVRRWQARQALEHVRAYEGAKKTRNTAGWHTTGSSANAENQVALPTLRNRSRSLVRDNPWCKKAIGGWVADAIGTGIRLGLPGDHAASKGWQGWAESTQCDADGLSDLYGIQALSARTMWESGAVIIRRRWRRAADGLVVPLQLQVLEPDYLDHGKTEETKTGYIIGGVEFNRLGQRTGYWLYDQHPGEALRMGVIVQSRWVDAADVIYAFKRLRPGQVHGVPELAPVIIQLRELDDINAATLTQQKVAACFGALITTDGGAASSIAEVKTDETGKAIQKLAPGMMMRLAPGESVSFAQPTPTNGYGDFVRVGLRAAAAGVEMTYEQVTGDLSQVNYASSRAGMLPYRRSVEAWQWLTFIPMVCNRIVSWFNDAAVLVGKPAVPAGTDWTPPRFEWVDPVKDMKGELLKIAAGGQSFSEMQRRLGNQPDKVLAELKADWAALREAGIPISLDGLISLLTTPDELDETAQPEKGKPDV